MGERIDQYFRGLPDGWDSFPEFRAKASLIRTALEVRPAPTSLEAIPEPLRAYFEAPPLPSAWIPEVHYLAFGVAVDDVEGFSDEDFDAYWYEISKKLVQSPLYAGLLGLLTPGVLLRTAALRWSAFHRGIQLRTSKRGGALRLELSYPTGLVPELCARGYKAVFAAVTDTSRSSGEIVQVDRGDDFVVFEMQL